MCGVRVGIGLVNIGDGESMGAEGGVRSASGTAGRAGGGLLVVRSGDGDGVVRSGDGTEAEAEAEADGGVVFEQWPLL